MSAYGRQKVLVTGGAGYLGSHTVKALLQVGYDVVVLDSFNSETTLPEEKYNNVACLEAIASITGSQLVVYNCSVLDQDRVTRILNHEKPNKCIHAAAVVMDRRSVDAPIEFLTNNIIGSQVLLSAMATTATVEHLVLISSRSAIGEVPTAASSITEAFSFKPINTYGASKAAVEILCFPLHNETGLPVSICRMQPIFGYNSRPDMLPRQLLENIYVRKPIVKYGTGEAIRDWLFISDAVSGILAALEKPMGYEVFNLGTGIGVSVNDLIAMAEDVVGCKAIIHHAPVLGRPKQPIGLAHFLDLRVRAQNPAILGIPM